MSAISRQLIAGIAQWRSTMSWRISSGRLRKVAVWLRGSWVAKRLCIPYFSNSSALRDSVRWVASISFTRSPGVWPNKIIGRISESDGCRFCSEAVRTCNLPQPASTRLDGALLGLAIYCDETEGRAIAVAPLEVVQSRPVGVAAHVDPVTHAGGDAAEGTLDVGNPSRVVVGGNPILCHDDRKTRGFASIPDCRFERLWPELVIHLGKFHALFWFQGTGRPEALSGVGLDTDKIVTPRPLQIDIQQLSTHVCRHLLAAGSGLDVLHGEGETDSAVSRPSLDSVDRTSVRGQNRCTPPLRIGIQKRREARGIATDSACSQSKPCLRASSIHGCTPHGSNEWANVDLIECTGQGE